MLCLAKIHSNTASGATPPRQAGKNSTTPLRDDKMTRTELQEMVKEIKINKRVKGTKSMQYARETGLLI